MNSNDYLLTTSVAKQLYYNVAKDLPLIDFHNHLSIQSIAEDRQFEDIAEAWILTDPYKHRAMRICGVDEFFITGEADHKTKFKTWCSIFPMLMGNPLYDWTVLELDQIFGLKTEINEENAEYLWNELNYMLREKKYSAQNILKQFNIEYVAPCASITDELSPFQCMTEIAPSLRGDNIIYPDNSFIQNLSFSANVPIESWKDFTQAIIIRLDAFHKAGCRVADHALDNGFRYRECKSEKELFQKIQTGSLTAEEREELSSAILIFLSKEYKKRKWVLQLHIGAQRTTSSYLRSVAGPTGGFAAIGNSVDVKSLVFLLDTMEQKLEGLPNIILFTLNPADNAIMAVLSGSFRNVTQGPAWWWCDHLQGIREMLEYFSSFSVLSTFVGMTTDSRSLMSLLRHDYFRRAVCGWIGEKVERGELPQSSLLLEKLVRKICYENAKTIIKTED